MPLHAAAVPPARLKDDRQSLPIALLRAREAVMGLFRPHHRQGGISEPQWRVIRVLHLEGETDATTLARLACLLPPSLSRILKDLEAADLVRRRPGRGDSRQSLLSLSPKAAGMVARVAPFLDGIHRDIARRFGRDRLDTLLTLLAELETVLADSSVPSPPPSHDRHTGKVARAGAVYSALCRRGHEPQSKRSSPSNHTCVAQAPPPPAAAPRQRQRRGGEDDVSRAAALPTASGRTAPRARARRARWPSG